MPAKNNGIKRALAGFAQLLANMEDGEEEDPRPRPKNNKGRGQGKGGGRGTKPKPAAPATTPGPNDPGYDEELHGSSSGGGGQVPENPCYICMVLGHLGRDHDLPSAWPEKLRQRWQRNRDLWAVTRAAVAAGFKPAQIVKLFDVDMSSWGEMDDMARLVALTETAALRDVGVQRWECGTSPLSPPPATVRRGPPRAKYVAGVDVDAAADDSEDGDGEDGMEEDEPSPKVAKGPEPRKRPPGTPSKGGGGGGANGTRRGDAASIGVPVSGRRRASGGAGA